MKAQEYIISKGNGHYIDYNLPSGAVIISGLDDEVNCARCGKAMIFGDGFTSRTIQSKMGFGYCVCENCYSKEEK